MSSENRTIAIRSSVSLKINQSFLVILSSCLCMLIQFYALPNKMSSWIAISNRALLAIWIVVVGVMVFRHMLKPISGDAVSVVLIVVCTVISWLFAVVNDPGGAVDNALRIAGFLMLPMMLGYSWFYRMDPRVKTIVLVTFAVVAMIFIGLYHSNVRNNYQGPYGIVQLDAVTLGYANPNQTAMYTFLCAIGLFVGVFYFQSKYLKFFFFAVGCYVAWIMYETLSRTTAFLFVVFAAMAFYGRKRDIPQWWIHTACLLPAVYLLFSLILPLLNPNLTFMGGSIFAGRDRIYDRYFQQLNPWTFLLGNMNYFGFDNMHNGYIAIAASVGVPVCIVYAKLLRSMLLRNCPDRNASAYERVAFVGVLCAIMNTSAEAALFVGGSQYAILLFSLIALFVNPAKRIK